MGFTKIQKVDVASAVSTMDFTSIPSSYKDLLLYLCIRGTATSGGGRDILRMTFNGSNSGYSRVRGYAYGTSNFGADSSSSETYIPLGGMTNDAAAQYYFGALEIAIYDYTASHAKGITDYYGCVGSASTEWVTGAGQHGWTGTAAISSISLYFDVGNIKAGSTGILYGIS